MNKAGKLKTKKHLSTTDKISRRSALGLILFGIILSLILLEVMLRIIPEKISKIDFSIAEDNRLFSSTRGFKYKPNSYRNWTSLGPPTIWYFNNYGFRDRPFETNDISSKVYKIAFVGDSMVMGLGVEDYQALPRQLEYEFQPKQFSGGDTQFYQVYNLGLWATGPIQYDATLEEEGMTLHPNLVIVGYFINDTSDDFVFDKERLYNFFDSVPDSVLPYPISEFLKDHSNFYLFLLTKYYSFIERFKYSKPLTNTDLIQGWKLNGQAIRKMESISEKNGAKFLLLAIPGINQVLSHNEGDRINKIKKYIIGNNRMNFLDLEPFLSNYPDPKELYIDGEDTHFDVKGNEIVAKYLANYLKENHLVPN